MASIRTADGVQLRHWLSGSASDPTLVLSHGGYSSASDFRHLVELLSDVIPCVTYDRRGCGSSAGDRTPTTKGEWARDLAGLVDELALDRPVIGGVSFGAMLSLEAALQNPDGYRGLVLISGTAREFVPVPDWNVHFPDVRRRLPELTTPTLVIHGDDDPVFALEEAEEMAALVPGSRLLILTGGHALLDVHSRSIARAVHEFVESLP